MKTRTITQFGLLTAVALVLGWLDRMIPMPIVGIKLGLANTVLLYALCLMNRKSAVMLMLLKVSLSALLFGSSAWTFLVSLGGGIASLLVMILFLLIPRMPLVAVSVAGAIFHMVGQLLVIVLFHMAPWSFILIYLPILGVAAVITGMLTGISAKYAMKGLQAYSSNRHTPTKS